jgi:hypothetical protein
LPGSKYLYSIYSENREKPWETSEKYSQLPGLQQKHTPPEFKIKYAICMD